MKRSQFWYLIEKTKGKSTGDCQRQVANLRRELERCSAEEIIGFNRVLHELLARSYRWDLWAAARIINGWTSDDGFDYFRGWLIAQGEKAFVSTLRNPDSLADFPGTLPEEVDCEAMLYVARDAYEKNTGEWLLPGRAYLPHQAAQPHGERWDAATVASICPRLAARVAAERPAGGSRVAI